MPAFATEPCDGTLVSSRFDQIVREEHSRLFINFHLGKTPQRDKTLHCFDDETLISYAINPYPSEFLLVDKPSML